MSKKEVLDQIERVETDNSSVYARPRIINENFDRDEVTLMPVYKLVIDSASLPKLVDDPNFMVSYFPKKGKIQFYTSSLHKNANSFGGTTGKYSLGANVSEYLNKLFEAANRHGLNDSSLVICNYIYYDYDYGTLHFNPLKYFLFNKNKNVFIMNNFEVTNDINEVIKHHFADIKSTY